MRSPLESPQQWLPVRLVGRGDLYQFVNVCEVVLSLIIATALTVVFSPTQLWIVAPLPPLAMDLLAYPLLAQLSEGR